MLHSLSEKIDHQSELERAVELSLQKNSRLCLFRKPDIVYSEIENRKCDECQARRRESRATSRSSRIGLADQSSSLTILVHTRVMKTERLALLFNKAELKFVHMIGLTLPKCQKDYLPV